jgi:hypothetical protein
MLDNHETFRRLGAARRGALAVAVAAAALVVPAYASAAAGDGAFAGASAHLASAQDFANHPEIAQPASSVAAWDAQHLPSPAPGYLPRTTTQPVRPVHVTSPSSGSHDAGIGAAFAAFVLALLGGAAVIVTRGNKIRTS